MCDKFLCGLVLGMLGGAVIVANSKKIRQAIKKGQEKAKEKMEQCSEHQTCCECN